MFWIVRVVRVLGGARCACFRLCALRCLMVCVCVCLCDVPCVFFFLLFLMSSVLSVTSRLFKRGEALRLSNC